MLFGCKQWTIYITDPHFSYHATFKWNVEQKNVAPQRKMKDERTLFKFRRG